MIQIIAILILILLFSISYFYMDIIKKWYTGNKKKIFNGLAVFTLVSSSLVGVYVISNPSDEWIIDGNSVYIDNSFVFASATPHTIYGSDKVVFNFTSKVYNGDVDFAWGFNNSNVYPTAVEIWRNYTHFFTGKHLVEYWGKKLLRNVSGYTNLGISNYDLYDVTLGNKNNTYLFNVSYNYNINGSFDTGIFAFSNYNTDGNNYTLSGNYNVNESYQYTKDFFDWIRWDANFTKINYEHGGMTKWYILKGVSVIKDKSYRIRASLRAPITVNESSGKYWWAFKPSNETLQESIIRNHFYCLDPWWNSSWSYFKTVTIDSGQVYNSLVNFPVLVNITDTDLRDKAQDDGDDIVFTDSANTIQYNHEVEKWDNTTGNLIAWVNVTSISSSVDTILNMYYGNAVCSEQQNATNTWDSHYVSVWHCNQSSAPLIDSTTYDKNTINTHNTPTYQSTGIVGYGVALTETGGVEGFDIPDDYGIFGGSNDYTLEAWYTGNDNTNNQRLYSLYGEALAIFWLLGGEANDPISFWTRNGGWDILSDNNYPLNTWTFAASVRDTSNGKKLYIDTDVVSDAWTSSQVSRAEQNSIGCNGVSPDDGMEGTIDEFRISNCVRNFSWLNTVYNTITNATDGGFLTFGNEKTEGAPPVGVTYYNQTIRNDGIDYFMWLDSDMKASVLDNNITGFDEASEYIGIWDNGTWNNSDGNWLYWFGDGTGTDFDAKCFDVIQVYLTDAGTQNITMEADSGKNYTKSYTHTWLNNSATGGYNFTGKNTEAMTSLSAINTSVTLQNGEGIALWNETTYTWNWWLPGFYETNVNVHRWDVIISKVEDTETWAT